MSSSCTMRAPAGAGTRPSGGSKIAMSSSSTPTLRAPRPFTATPTAPARLAPTRTTCPAPRAPPPRAQADTAAPSDTGAAVTAADALLRWCIEDHALPATALEPASLEDDLDRSTTALGFVASREASKGDILLEIPGDLAITSVDVAKDPLLEALAQGRSELVGLALFLMKERGQGGASTWAPLLATLPARTDTPVLWDDAERAELLKGSPVLEESRSREAALRTEWEDIAAAATAAGATLDPSIFSVSAFLDAMSVVLATAAYLPTAQCFALLPLVGSLRRTGSAGGAVLDYDLDRQSVTLVASRPYTRGQEVRLYDGRPSGEVLLATGALEPANPTDCLTLPASLVAADRLYSQKLEILGEFGFGPSQEFPIFEDRMATQHLAYMRLARLTDPAQFAKISFEQDIIVSPENEYEVLQLVMADLRERLQSYEGQLDDDVKELQRRDLPRRARMAAALRAAEKRVLRGTMDGVRRRLAPIRGIPTKAGTLADPNADFKEIFDTLEAIPSAPKRLFDGIAAWARGEDDPEWKKKGKGPR